MSTSPRARARPSIDSASTGSTMPGNSVTMSMRIRVLLQVEQPVGRPDDDPAAGQVDLDHDLGYRRDEALARPVGDHPQIVGRRMLDARHPADVAPVFREDPASFHLPRIEAARRQRQRLVLGPRDLTDDHEPGAHLYGEAMSGHSRAGSPVVSYFGAGTGTFAISFRTVFDGWAPFLIHASTFARSIATVGGSVSGL